MKRLISVFLTALMLLQTIVLPVEAQTTGTCSGSINCNSFASQNTCANYGCSWTSTGTCSGTGANCTTYLNSQICTTAGCTWTSTGTCSGTATTACSSLSETNCNAAGCSWTTTTSNKVYLELTNTYDGGENICMDFNIKTEGSPTLSQLELWVDGTYYDVSQGKPNEIIPSGSYPGVCNFGPSCNDDKNHEVKWIMRQSDGSTKEASGTVFCKAEKSVEPVKEVPIEKEFHYTVDITSCTTDSVTYKIQNTGTSDIKAQICGDVYYLDNNMGGFECKDLSLSAGSSQEIKSQVWADLRVGKTFTYKFNIWGQSQQSDTCEIKVEKQVLRASSAEGIQIVDLLNKAVEYAEKLESGTISLAEFFMYVEREIMEEERRIWDSLDDSKRTIVAQELITVPSGENRAELRLYSGSIVKITISVEKSAKWDMKGNLVYKWQLNVWTDTPGLDWQERDKAWQEADRLWESRKQEKQQGIAAEEAERLRASLPSNLLEKADIMHELILDVIKAIKQYEKDEIIQPLAEARAKARIESEKIMRDLFEDPSVKPLQLLDLAHLVVLEAPGTTEMWEEKGELKINYWKPVYPETRDLWEMAELRLNIDTSTKMDLKELKWNPPFVNVNIDKREEWTRRGPSEFNDAIWKAEDEYRRKMEVGIAESKAQKIIAELKALIPTEILKELTDVKSKIADYRTIISNYATGDATIYDVEYKRLKTEDEINQFIANNIDWEYALDAAMIIMAESAGEPLQMWGEDQLPDCKKIYSNVQYGMKEEEVSEDEWPIESDICVMRINKKEFLKMKQIKEKMEEMKEEECIMRGFVEVPHFVSINANWMLPWEFISKNVNRAGEAFFRERDSKAAKKFLEERLVPKAEEEISEEALALKPEIISKIKELKELTTEYNKEKVTAFDLQYNVIKVREELGDKIRELSNEDQINLFILVVNELSAEGYPNINRPPCGTGDFDGIGITLATGELAELNIGGHKFYEPFFSEYLGEKRMVSRLDVQMDVSWKKCSSKIEEEIQRAWEKIESERVNIEIEKVKKQRAELEANMENRIRDLIKQKEDAKITAEEFKKQVFGIYRELENLDHETAKVMMRMGKDSFPEEYKPIDVSITTNTGIEVRIYEKTYTYGVGRGEIRSEYSEQSKAYAEKVIEEQEIRSSLEGRAEGMGTPITVEESGLSETQRTKLTKIEGQSKISEVTGEAVGIAEGKGEESVQVSVSVDIPIEQIRKYAGKGAREAITVEEAPIEVMEGMSIKVNVDVRIMSAQMVTKEARPEDFRTVKGLIPVNPPTINVALTKEDLRKSGDEVKARWANLKESGEDIKAQMLYSLNQEFASNPLITEILLAWGNTITSFKLTREDGSLMEASFKTENGQLADVKFEIDPQAGTSSNNILIEVNYEAITDLMNWWRGKLKDTTSPLALLINLPAFGFRLLGMMITGQIKVSPWMAIFKFGDFLKVFDSAAKFATTGTLI